MLKIFSNCFSSHPKSNLFLLITFYSLSILRKSEREGRKIDGNFLCEKLYSTVFNQKYVIHKINKKENTCCYKQQKNVK